MGFLPTLWRTSRCIREALLKDRGGSISSSTSSTWASELAAAAAEVTTQRERGLASVSAAANSSFATTTASFATGTTAAAADFDLAVVGAGVVGLAIARAAARAGADVLLLEAAPAAGRGTSSRSSEVVHAGLYYAPGSAKAALCVEGRRRLYDYCEKRGVAYRRLGKLVVATAPGQTAQLEALAATGATNGVGDLRLLTAGEARALEPALQCYGALLSPSTGIVDSHGLMQALLADATAAGATLAVNSRLVAADAGSSGGGAKTLTVEDAASRDVTRVTARALVNAAGLNAHAVARRIAGVPAAAVPPRALAKGSYFALAAPARPPFSRLIYPLPEPGGLGVHLTLDLTGAARFGPDVEWLRGDEVEEEEEGRDLVPAAAAAGAAAAAAAAAGAAAGAAAEAGRQQQQQGRQQHAGQNEDPCRHDGDDSGGGPRGAIDYSVDPRRADAFYPAVRAYWPGLPDGALAPAYSGVRPKVAGRGAPAGDFVIQGARRCVGGGGSGGSGSRGSSGGGMGWRPQGHGVPGVVCLYGIESPGLTASLAIAERVMELLREDDVLAVAPPAAG